MQVFDLFLVPNHGGHSHSLDCTAVSRFYGEFILQNSGNALNLSDFLRTWQQAVPEGVETDIEHLRGVSFIDEAKQPQVIRYFPEWQLTDNLQERLAQLFQLRPKWTLQDIKPFVEKLTTPKLDVKALLTKYARVSMINGEKHFSSKHGK